MTCRLLTVLVALSFGCTASDSSNDESASEGGGSTTTTTTGTTTSTATSTTAPAESSSDEGVKYDIGVGEGTTYLLALSTPIEPDLPFQFLADIAIVDAVLTISLQPLSLDQGSTTTPRQPVGDPLEGDVMFMVSAFSDDFGDITIPGAANAISGEDVALSLQLIGMVSGLGAPCGIAEGTVTAPVAVDLSGSSWAAVHVTGVNDLPDDFPVACP